MNKDNTVSVVLCLYNGERFITEQLDSLRCQSYGEIEVVVADDGSTDNGVAVIEAYIASHRLETWKVIRNRENKGYAKNFLDTCGETTGSVIFFSDQDDIWEPDKIERMMDVLREHPELQVLSSDLAPFTVEKGAAELDRAYLEKMKNNGELEIFGTADAFHVGRSGCTMCIRRQFYDDIISYWRTGWGHDEFVWKMSCVTRGCGVIHIVTTHRRMHSGNATNIKVRTRDWRIRQLGEMTECNASLRAYAVSRNAGEEVLRTIDRFGESLALRRRLLTGHNPFIWLRLWCQYADCYPRRKGLYLDLYLFFFKTSKRNH